MDNWAGAYDLAPFYNMFYALTTVAQRGVGYYSMASSRGFTHSVTLK